MLGFFFFKQKTAYEMRISDWSSDVCSTEAKLIAAALEAAPPAARKPLLNRLGAESRTRLRIYAPFGGKRMDSWAGAPATYTLRNPAMEPWDKRAARILDDIVNTIDRKHTSELQSLMRISYAVFC